MATVPQVSVFGEALVDLIVSTEGVAQAVFGGAPFNTARALGRLGVGTSFVGSISEDRFGSGLITELTNDGVSVEHVRRTSSPTTLALAELSASGSASYRFYVNGTSAEEMFHPFDHSVGGWMMSGGLGLVLNPVADQIADCLMAKSPSTRAMVDINCRPLVITRPEEYRARIDRVLAAVDVVKVSDEDLEYLYPGRDVLDAAQELLETGPSLVLVTAGSDPVEILAAHGSARVDVPPTEVVDTIGAGDTFGAGFLAWWVVHSDGASVDDEQLRDLDLVKRAVQAGVHASAVAVGRRGADPPFRNELPSNIWG